MRKGFLVILLALSAHRLVAQSAVTELHGSWSATAGPSQTFWGTWTAQVSPDKPNEAEGTWALFNNRAEIVVEGTWAANKARSEWLGSWAARTLPGQLYSGTWTADIPGSGDKSFKQMLEWTLEKDIFGSWRCGASKGQWRLTGPQSKSQNR